MSYKWLCVVAAALQVIGAARPTCPSDSNCVCGGTLAFELNCNVDGRKVTINLVPDIYINIKCENASSLDYNKLPRCANRQNTFKSVSFKDCPLPATSFKDILTKMGVSKTMALIFQNTKNLSGYFDRRHFAGLQDLTKLLLSINGNTQLPDDLFTDINNLTWLNIRSNSINLSENLLKPLERLETLEISHNHMTNISSNMFSHLSFLRKLSLWQSNVTWFSKDFFTGVDVLEELDLSSNGLNELPASIFKPLRKLKKLTLFSNKFSSLPRHLFESNSELETVIILNNDVTLKELPRCLFGSLMNLKQVYIQRCGLEIIPYDVFGNSPKITNISLAYNNLEALPEAIFNDQINLLELDLSHNNLKELEPKLFSSLVRLEHLNLDYNQLIEISGSTFSSLLSLIYLSVEHNKLKTVSSYLFSNNKQRMYISLSYNHLNFENNGLDNNTLGFLSPSPFANTFYLKVLNLSHNEFTSVFSDWFLNAHDTLDLRFNNIRNLMFQDNPKPMWSLKGRWGNQHHIYHHVLISENPIICSCSNLDIISFLSGNHYQWDDLYELGCSWKLCGKDFEKDLAVVFCVLGSTLMITIFCIVNVLKRTTRNTIKDKLRNTTYPIHEKRKPLNLTIKCSNQDEEFVQTHIVPSLSEYQNLIVEIIHSLKDGKVLINRKNQEKCMTLVVFSTNYLTSVYHDVSIKKIRGEMLKAKNTVYIFTDIGTDNSIYAFLKEQRDYRSTILWSDPKFWHHLRLIVKCMQRGRLPAVRDRRPGTTEMPARPGYADLYAIEPYAHIQV